jgi:outer membrane protein assembly factor BamB
MTRGGARAILAAVVALVVVGCTGAEGDPATAPSPSTPPSTSAYGPGWSAVHADAANTDYSSVDGAADLEPAWDRALGGRINLGATFDREGRVYVTTDAPGCHLYVLDPGTGETIWCSDAVDRYAVMSAPLLDRDGHAYLADSEAMRAFDPDGDVLWKTPISGVPLSAQFTPDGRVVFVTHLGTVYVLDRTTGAPAVAPLELNPGATFDPAAGLWACARGTPECPSANTPAIDPRSGLLVFTFWAPGAPRASLVAMDVTEGARPAIEPRWQNDSLPGGSASSPDLSADGTRVYVNDNVDSLHALDTATGEVVWSYPIGYAPGGSASLSPDGLIMPAGGSRAVMAIQDDGRRARLAWRLDDTANRGVATQAGGHRAYVTVSAGERTNDLVVVDTRGGVELDREHLPGTTFFTVGTTIGPDGLVLVPTFAGQLFAFGKAG